MGIETGRRVVFAGGVWDLLHHGHCNLLYRAKALGDVLVVGVATDEWSLIRSDKPPPIWSYERRFAAVASLPYVDVVVPLTDFTDYTAIWEHEVTIRVVAPEYGYMEAQRVVRADLERMGIEFVIIPRTPGISSRQLRKELGPG